MGKAFSQLKLSRRPPADSSTLNLWERDLRRTICVLGASTSSAAVSAVSAAINERVKGHDSSKQHLPFDAVVDKTEVFYEEQVYFGRMGSESMRTDHRADAFAKLAALVFVVDATDLSSAFKFEWKRAGYIRETDMLDDAALNKLSMKENEDWLLQMADRRLDVLVNKPILVLLTNSQATNASTAEQARDRLLSNHLTGRNIRVQECGKCSDSTAGTALSGLQEGLDWIAGQVHNLSKARGFLANKKNYPINSNVVLGKLSRRDSLGSTPPLVVKSSNSMAFTLNSVISAAKVAM